MTAVVCALEFANDGRIFDARTGDLVATGLDDLDMEHLVATYTDVQVMWPVVHGQMGQSHAYRFLLEWDATRA